MRILLCKGEEVLYSKKKARVAPGEMESIRISKDLLVDGETLTLKLEVIA